MVEIKVVSYEQARTDFLKAEIEKAENRMKFWQTKIKKAKNAIAEMEAHDNASNAGWEVNFYKDALEALENQPKWISVEERLPEQEGMYIVYIKRNKGNAFIGTDHYDFLNHWGGEGWYDGRYVTHWMPFDSLPEPPKEDV